MSAVAFKAWPVMSTNALKDILGEGKLEQLRQGVTLVADVY